MIVTIELWENCMFELEKVQTRIAFIRRWEISSSAERQEALEKEAILAAAALGQCVKEIERLNNELTQANTQLSQLRQAAEEVCHWDWTKSNCDEAVQAIYGLEAAYMSGLLNEEAGTTPGLASAPR
jgi:hypothetical protein